MTIFEAYGGRIADTPGFAPASPLAPFEVTAVVAHGPIPFAANTLHPALAVMDTSFAPVGGAAAGTFSTKDVGTGKAVTVTGNTLSGSEAGNYTATQQSGLTANITPKALSVTGLTATGERVPVLVGGDWQL